jgi:hypothetical protein
MNEVAHGWRQTRAAQRAHGKQVTELAAPRAELAWVAVDLGAAQRFDELGE